MNSLIRLLRALSMVALCAGTTSALAQKPGAISLTQVAPASLRLRFENPTSLVGRVQVVRLHGGQTLFTEPYTGSAYGHRFDFDHVPSGRYLVFLQAGDQVHHCMVWVQTRGQESYIRRIKLDSPMASAAVVVTTWRSASGSRTVASTAVLSPTNPSQHPQEESSSQ